MEYIKRKAAAEALGEMVPLRPLPPNMKRCSNPVCNNPAFTESAATICNQRLCGKCCNLMHPTAWCAKHRPWLRQT